MNSFHNDIENIKSNLIKNAYPPFLINNVIKKYLDFKFLLTKINLKKNLTIITLNYHISAIFHTISRLNLRNFGKSFVKKILILSYFLIHSKLKIAFQIKNQFLMIWNLSWYINLLVLAVVLAILAKLVVMLKIELRCISKRITSLIFSNIYSRREHAWTHIILFVSK